MNGNSLIKLLKSELREGLGCTEPASIGLACANASNIMEEDIEEVQLTVNMGLFKNAFSVCIPNTNKYGVKLAAALGIILRNPEKELTLFEDIDDNIFKKAEEIVSKDKIKVNIKYTNRFYINVKVLGKTHCSEVLVVDGHTNTVKIVKDGNIIFQKDYESKVQEQKSDIKNCTISEIKQIVENCNINELYFIKDAIDVNMKLANQGIKDKRGIGIGYELKQLMDRNVFSNNIINKACLYVSAASDARMGGVGTSAMTLMGSGNQGIQAIIPVAVVGNEIDASIENIVKAVSFSCLVTIYMKKWSGRLSPLCGATIAATGAGAGITWLLGGNLSAINGTINNMCAGVMGIVCDGAKEGCSLKLRTCTENAIISSYLSIEGITSSFKDGLVSAKVEDTIKNVGRLSSNGMKNIDSTILEILEQK